LSPPDCVCCHSIILEFRPPAKDPVQALGRLRRCRLCWHYLGSMFPLLSWTFEDLREGKCGGTGPASRRSAIRTESTSSSRCSNALSSAAVVSGASELKSCCHRDSACWLFNGSRMRLVSNCPSQFLLFVPQGQCEPLRTTSVTDAAVTACDTIGLCPAWTSAVATKGVRGQHTDIRVAKLASCL
jgi:hypothetical protein